SVCFFFQAEDGIRDFHVTGVQTCALPIFADSLRAGEAEASDAWANAVEGMETRMMEAIRRVSEADRHALDSARQRLQSLSDEARRLDENILERADTFHERLVQRNVQAAEREAAELAALQERLAAFDAQISERQQATLAHVSGLADRGDALAQRRAAPSSEMERLAPQGRHTQDGLAEAATRLSARLSKSLGMINESGSK